MYFFAFNGIKIAISVWLAHMRKEQMRARNRERIHYPNLVVEKNINGSFEDD